KPLGPFVRQCNRDMARELPLMNAGGSAMAIQLRKLFLMEAVCLTILLLHAVETYSDSPAKRFVVKVNGAGFPVAAIQTSDGDYVSLSQSASAEPGETITTYMIRKIDSSGKKIWQNFLQLSDRGDAGKPSSI